MNNSDQLDCQKFRPYLLKNSIQHYSWGTRNDNAFIAHLLGIDPEQDLPFAELWMGTHPKAPSLLIDPQQGSHDLAEWIKGDPENRLSTKHSMTLQYKLPYLFKVLSACEALSIQAHPNKQQAERLHKRDPDHYPDDNHKPEVAIAIDHLDALVGFVSAEQYEAMLKRTPEIAQLLKGTNSDIGTLKASVLGLLSLWENNNDEVEGCIMALHSRLSGQGETNAGEQLFLDLASEIGYQDIGLLFLFFLNRVHLAPGEAVFLPPGVPHAYLKGNIIECMANSDNVVRLGLTEKFCDAQALAEILVFDGQTDFKIETTSDGYLREYLSPTHEFRIKGLNLMQGESRAFSYRSSFTMFLLLEGEVSLHWGDGKSSCTSVYRRGNSFIAPANLKEFTLQARNHSKLFIVDIPDNQI